MLACGSQNGKTGVYSNTLDLVYSEGSKADPPLIALLKTAIRRQRAQTLPINPHTDLVNHRISLPPRPYTTPESASCIIPRKSTLSLSPFHWHHANRILCRW